MSKKINELVKIHANPHSGSKPVGIQVDLLNGTPKHFPEGCKWRYARVLDMLMLEVFDGKSGSILYQTQTHNVAGVSGSSFTTPLWLSREYPLPREDN